MATRFSIDFTGTGDESQPIISGARQVSMIRLRQLLKRLQSGTGIGWTLATRNTAVPASMTVTLASVLANDTITVGGIVFTAVTGASTGDQFTRGVSDTADAAAAAAAITASTPVGAAGVYACTSALGVLTVKAVVAGSVGNAIAIATSNGTRLAITGSASRLASGAETLISLAY